MACVVSGGENRTAVAVVKTFGPGLLVGPTKSVGPTSLYNPTNEYMMNGEIYSSCEHDTSAHAVAFDLLPLAP